MLKDGSVKRYLFSVPYTYHYESEWHTNTFIMGSLNTYRKLKCRFGIVQLLSVSNCEHINYLPVSLLPCFSKIPERGVFDRCIDYFTPNLSTSMGFIQFTK